LKKSLKMLVQQLGRDDRIAIVAYAGSDRVVLGPTSAAERKKYLPPLTS
jgi:Ca-activated chloride channel family protein